MSEPLEYDFAQIAFGDGGSPETFTVVCDMTQVTVNEGAQTNTYFRRDCTTPGSPSKRRSRVVGTFWDISGTGLANAPQTDDLRALIGVRNNYEIYVFQDDGSAAGERLGTYSGEAIMTAKNNNVNREGDSAMDISLEGQSTFTFTPENSGS